MGADKLNDSVNRPIYTLAITWVLILPLLFFVARGSFSFDRGESGYFTQGEEEALSTTGAGSTYFQLEQALIYVIVVASVFPSLSCLGSIIRDNKMVFSLPTLALISALWSQSLIKTIPFGIFAIILTVFGIYLSHRFSPERQVELFLFVGWVAIILSVIAALLFPSAGIALSYGTGAWRGMWVQKNVCGMITTLLMYAAFCVKPRGALQRSALILFVLTAIVIVIMSQSRTAWILLAMSLFFIALLRVYGKLRNHERLLFVLSLAFIITAMASAAIAYTPQIAIALGKDPTLTGRLEIWRAIAPELWKRPLLGYGYRAFWLGMKGESWNVSTALGSTIAIGNSENAILEIWLELGVIGVVLALLMLFQVCRNAATCLSEDSPRYIHWYILIVFFNLVSLVDGEKIMFPHTIEWVLFVMAYVGLSAEARRLRSERAE